jgi:hypothetical protein
MLCVGFSYVNFLMDITVLISMPPIRLMDENNLQSQAGEA